MGQLVKYLINLLNHHGYTFLSKKLAQLGDCLLTKDKNSCFKRTLQGFFISVT